MKPNSIKPAHRPWQSTAGVIRLQRIYTSSASGPNCIVPGSGGHQSASGRSAGGSASPTPARIERPSPLNTTSSPLNQQIPSPNRIPSPPSRRQHCPSYTYSTGKGFGDCNPYMRNEPNLKTSGPTVTLDMIRTYNGNLPKKRKKNEPKTHQKRTKNEKKRTKSNQNEPISPHSRPPPALFVSHFSMDNLRAIIYHRALPAAKIEHYTQE